jgi:hypothetical protein
MNVATPTVSFASTVMKDFTNFVGGDKVYHELLFYSHLRVRVVVEAPP